MTENLTLAEAAERLGVHYMTAYKYVRTGRLNAHKDGGLWVVPVSEVEEFRSEAGTEHRREDAYPELIEARLIAGDDSGAHRILVDALASGAGPEEAYIDLLGGALTSIGRKWAIGELSIADEHMATATALRVIARLGAKLAAKGKTRGTILLAVVPTDTHALPTAMMHDLLRIHRFDALDLGADTPAESISHTAVGIVDLLAVGLAATRIDNEHNIRQTLHHLSETTTVPVVLGGGAIRSVEHANTLGPCIASTSPRHALELFDTIAVASRGS